MSFTDPISLNPGSGAVSLPRIAVRDNGSTYSSADGTLKVTADSQYGKRIRRVLRVDFAKITADPFLPATNSQKSMSNYMVFDLPATGFSVSEALALYSGFLAVYNASSAAMITKLLGGES